MATKDHLLCKSRFPVGSSDTINFNLNRKLQCLRVETVHSNNFSKKSKKIQNYDISVDTQKSKSLTKPKNKFQFECLDVNSGSDKFASKSDSSKSKNNSTLSLHIAAYENSVEAIGDSVKEGNLCKNKSFCKNDNHMTLLDTNNPFEFPRQQSDDTPDPAIMHFTASQKLLNPNETPSNDILDTTFLKDETIKESNQSTPQNDRLSTRPPDAPRQRKRAQQIWIPFGNRGSAANFRQEFKTQNEMESIADKRNEQNLNAEATGKAMEKELEESEDKATEARGSKVQPLDTYLEKDDQKMHDIFSGSESPVETELRKDDDEASKAKNRTTSPSPACFYPSLIRSSYQSGERQMGYMQSRQSDSNLKQVGLDGYSSQRVQSRRFISPQNCPPPVNYYPEPEWSSYQSGERQMGYMQSRQSDSNLQQVGLDRYSPQRVQSRQFISAHTCPPPVNYYPEPEWSSYQSHDRTMDLSELQAGRSEPCIYQVGREFPARMSQLRQENSVRNRTTSAPPFNCLPAPEWSHDDDSADTSLGDELLALDLEKRKAKQVKIEVAATLKEKREARIALKQLKK